MSIHEGHVKPIKVTIADPETGDVLEDFYLKDDYAIITAGRRYVKHIQIMGKTHMLAVALESQKGSTDGRA